MRSNFFRNFVFILFQDLILLAAFFTAAYLRYLWDQFDLFTFRKMGGLLIIFGVTKLAFHYFNLYEVALHISFRQFAKNLLKALIAAVLLLTVIYYVYPPAIVGQYILAMSVLLVMLGTILYRLLWGELSEESSFTQKVLVLGTGRAARLLLEDVLRYSESGYRIVGVVSESSEGPKDLMGFPIIGQTSDLLSLIHVRRVDLLVVALDEQRGNMPVAELMPVKMAGVRIIDNIAFHEQFTGKIVLESLRPSWFIFTDGFKVGRLRLVTKRVFDVFFASLGLIVSAPVCLLFAILVKATSRGPLFYRQERTGWNGREFDLLKLRSMFENAEDETGPVWAAEADPRVTPVGRFIRQYRIDEVPQMWNVLKGEMSFVGPRPERPVFIEQLARELPYYHQRHVVKPGITGWAQVRYPYGATVDDAKEKLQLDLYYIKHTNLGFDLKILVETLKTLFRKMAR
jgi:sugar transferase (PEP-CTERM system associated)